MYAKVLEQRTRYKVEPFLSQAQMGFRKGRGCTDTIFALRQLSEKVIKHDRELNIVFVDQEKAFDRVNRDKVWQTLELYNIQDQVLDSIRATYANSMSPVLTSIGLTDWFDITSGVRQGCVLSPLLFIIYMDRITNEASLEPEALNELLFADDRAYHTNPNNTYKSTPPAWTPHARSTIWRSVSTRQRQWRSAWHQTTST